MYARNTLRFTLYYGIRLRTFEELTTQAHDIKLSITANGSMEKQGEA